MLPSGDWGYLLCHTPDSAAALEAASEDADIRVSGHVIKIQSLNTARLLYSSSQTDDTAAVGTESPLPVPRWRPFAAYAVYPDDYPDRPLDGDSPDDYGADEDASMSAGKIQCT